MSELDRVFDSLMEAGEPFGLTLAGYRALESLRLEKGYRAWGADITPNDTPFEAGLGWAVKLGGPMDFMGRSALEKADATRPRKKLATFVCEDADVVLLGRETILRDGKQVGYLSSGGFGYTVGRPIGLGYIRNPEGVSDEYVLSGNYELVVAMKRVPCRVSLTPLYDPSNSRLRG
jgi:4-methylaminobutanoate oxidase (formaldehyde-forming)